MNIESEVYNVDELAGFFNMKENDIGYTSSSDNNRPDRRGSPLPEKFKHPQTKEPLKFSHEYYDKNTNEPLHAVYLDQNNKPYSYTRYDQPISNQMRQDYYKSLENNNDPKR